MGLQETERNAVQIKALLQKYNANSLICMEAIGKGGPIMKLAVFMLGRHTDLFEIQNTEAMITHCQRMIAIDDMWKDDKPRNKECGKTAEQMAQSEVIETYVLH
jgi:hypothetical protein